MKVAVVTPIPTPYRDPFWNEVSRRPDIDLTVYYCSAGKADRPWSAGWGRLFRHEVLNGINLTRWRGADSSCFWNPTIRRRLRSGRFDAVVIGGYNHLTMLAAMQESQRLGIPYYVMCETYRAVGRRSLLGRLKTNVVRYLLSHAAGTFPTGILAAKYLKESGADPNAITYLPNVPDVIALSQDASQLSSRSAGNPLVLFVGRLITKKRPDALIRAFKIVRESIDARLTLVGDGPMRPQLTELVAGLNLGEVVQFAGFEQPADVSRWYKTASVFVMPSSETWGVSVIEALASGVPVVVSDEVGCHPDVVTSAVGQVVSPTDVSLIADAIRRNLVKDTSASTVLAAWTPVREMLRYDAIADRVISHLQSGLSFSVPVINVR